jgi:hypothetical protein
MGGSRLLLAAEHRLVIPFLIQISQMLIVVTGETPKIVAAFSLIV